MECDRSVSELLGSQQASGVHQESRGVVPGKWASGPSCRNFSTVSFLMLVVVMLKLEVYHIVSSPTVVTVANHVLMFNVTENVSVTLQTLKITSPKFKVPGREQADSEQQNNLYSLMLHQTIECD